MLNILKKSGIAVIMVIGLCVKAYPHTSQVATTSISIGQKSTLDTLSLGKLIEFSFTSGKPVKQIHVATECVILKIDVVDSLSWRQQKRYIKRLNRAIAALEFCPKPVQTLRSYSQIRWYPALSPYHSFLNPYNQVWIAPRRNLHIQSRPLNYRRRTYRRPPPRRNSRASTPRSIGRTRGTTRTTVRNSNSSSTTRAVNGRNRRTSSTTGVLRRPVSGSEQK